MILWLKIKWFVQAGRSDQKLISSGRFIKILRFWFDQPLIRSINKILIIKNQLFVSIWSRCWSPLISFNPKNMNNSYSFSYVAWAHLSPVEIPFFAPFPPSSTTRRLFFVLRAQCEIFNEQKHILRTFYELQKKFFLFDNISFQINTKNFFWNFSF